MTKHVLDRPRAPSDIDKQKPMRAARPDELHPSTQALLKRPRTQGTSRVGAFLKIARTGTAES